jgi:hypothetical protein
MRKDDEGVSPPQAGLLGLPQSRGNTEEDEDGNPSTGLPSTYLHGDAASMIRYHQHVAQTELDQTKPRTTTTLLMTKPSTTWHY